MVDEVEVHRLVVAAAGGDETAWRQLWAHVEAPLSRIIAHPRFLGRLGEQEDDRRNISVAVMARLRADQFRRLRLFLEARAENPRLGFLTWLRVVAKRVGIDYLRTHPDYVRRRDEGASSPGAWVIPKTLPPPSQIKGERPPVTDRGTVRELLAFASDGLSEQQRRALELWTQSETFDEIARILELAKTADAERLVRAALERLRRRVRAAEGRR